jgi:thiol-disulfide isomerase/thioredoxin
MTKQANSNQTASIHTPATQESRTSEGDNDSDKIWSFYLSKSAKLNGNIRQCFELIDPRKTCLLRFIVLILAIHAATSFEAAADGSHSSSDNQQANSNPSTVDHGELVFPNSVAFKAALIEYNETGMLVEFFLPWCGHSRRLRPELAQVKLKSANVHYSASRSICQLDLPI